MITPTMKVAGPLMAAALLALSFGGHPAAQESKPVSAVERQRESNRGERMEKVGPTAWRVRPDDTPYDQLEPDLPQIEQEFRNEIVKRAGSQR